MNHHLTCTRTLQKGWSSFFCASTVDLKSTDLSIESNVSNRENLNPACLCNGLTETRCSSVLESVGGIRGRLSRCCGSNEMECLRAQRLPLHNLGDALLAQEATEAPIVQLAQVVHDALESGFLLIEAVDEFSEVCCCRARASSTRAGVPSEAVGDDLQRAQIGRPTTVSPRNQFVELFG